MNVLELFRPGACKVELRYGGSSRSMGVQAVSQGMSMTSRLTQIADDFWNIRGTFRIAGLIDIGTQMSLVRRPNGRFVLLDACEMSRATARDFDELTDAGGAIEAVLHLHPFHTVSVAGMQQRLPDARLYGTRRHVTRIEDLPWQSATTDDTAVHAEFADVLDFSVPQGVDFISDNEHVHFASVLAFHRASGTIHSDDTIMYVRLPRVLGMFGIDDALTFHPTLAKALEKRAGAAADFRQWARSISRDWGNAGVLCAAHTAVFRDAGDNASSLRPRLEHALRRVEPVLARHEQRYG